MDDLSSCQIPCLLKITEGSILIEKQPLKQQLKRLLAKPWNYHINNYLKKFNKNKVHKSASHTFQNAATLNTDINHRLSAGDWVRVRPRDEIQATLNNWNESKGCAFLDNMWPYCGTTQHVLVSMKRFLDERDYKVKKCNGIILLKDVMCEGTPVFGRCDRRCHYFWREEWLERIHSPDGLNGPNLTPDA